MVINYRNLIILGDFNNINSYDDQYAQIFPDTVDAMCFNQIVKFATHRKGNTPDHIFIEMDDIHKITGCRSLGFLSSHVAIQFNVDVRSEKRKCSVMKKRDLDSIDIQELKSHLDLNDLLELDEDLDMLVEEFDKRISTTLDTVAPVKTIRRSERKLQPWFNDNIKKQHTVLRRQEDI